MNIFFLQISKKFKRLQQKFLYFVTRFFHKDEIPRKCQLPQPRQSLKDARLCKNWRSIEVPGRSGRVRFPLLLKFGNCGNLWKWIGLDLRLSWHPAKLPPTLSVNYQCSALTNRCLTAFCALIDGPLLKK